MIVHQRIAVFAVARRRRRACRAWGRRGRPATFLAALFVFAALAAVPAGRAWPAETVPALYGGKTVDQWTTMLSEHLDKDTDADKEACRRAAAALGQMGPAAKQAVPLLVRALHSYVAKVMYAAVDALGRIGPDASASVPDILQYVDIPKDDINYAPLKDFRPLAASALGRMGPSAKAAVPVLEKALENEDPQYRVQAALALWRVARHQQAIPALVAIVEGQQAEPARQAVMALSEIGPDARVAAEVLVAALGHGDPDVRRAAAKALSKMGPAVLPPIADRLSSGALAWPEPAVYVLGQIAAELRPAIHDPRLDRAGFVAASRPVFEHAAPALVALLEHPRDEVRQAASRALAQMGILAAPALIDVLSGDRPRARPTAIDALTRLESYLPRQWPSNEGVEAIKSKMISPLMALMAHEDRDTRRAAYRAFAALSYGAQADAAMPLLRSGLADPDAAIRRYATKARDQLLKDAAKRDAEPMT